MHIYHPGAQRQYVTISVGVAAKSDATADELRLTRDADIALYTAKEHGRDCTIASSTMVGLPLKGFFLVLSSVGLAYRRRELAWVDGEELGVTFIETNPKNRRARAPVPAGP
ncbi:diguanylate cyclase [Bradyrhizobium sp. 45]|uniref:diguanylate cyclase domain-containing protein n=1 Tax=Bradyrhizobium sp. 45 TaxID=1043587 RepID=UPI00209696F6|nr:diguanylate cyclase [Bradyrhizobium sp. 45]